ncbi:venom carboxylesterase-6 [Lutzomyia longipalpis]|uniref:venom carboxylesterase-6 n=1 Tax=Lutzomyia longipalpis TaxID=7200 RepID=UPI0024835012|nr:venom carboxylesterase-6 [Lutzomyia longipalpis]
MKTIPFVYVIYALITCTIGLALAPAQVAEIAASTGQLSNKLKETAAWRRIMQSGGLVRILPARAMEVVREVVGSLRNEGRVVLATPNGILRGRHQPYKSGIPGSYYSFRGVRYGQAPVGARRFRAALPEKPWKGVRSAVREGNTCPHRNILLDTFKGDEDCLFLNIYTPELPNRTRHPQLPVMVWIHGGGFAFGSGNSFLYGPDYLVAEGIVLVTINYRLGPLGFLAVGGDAPGNAGLKDQVLALKWVQENIAAFGGDPTEVTIFGESAGGASVQYLMLSPLATGLFHRAISESGSALSPWAHATKPKERAFKLGQVLGLSTNNTEELLDFLRKVPPRKLIDASEETLTPEDARNNIGLPFVPSIEENIETWDDADPDVNHDEPFLTEPPIDLLKRGNFHKIPYITGFNSHEAMLFLRRLRKDPNLLVAYQNDSTRVLPADLQVPGGRDSREGQAIAGSVRKFYLGSRPITQDTINELIDMWTDLMFVRGIVTSARLHGAARNATTYLYRFAFDGALGLYKRLLGISRPGVCHGDEIGYLFHFGFFNLSLDKAAPEIQVKKRMVSMWTNFAKYGVPTPMGAYDPDFRVNWDPILQKSGNDLPYLDITDQLKMKVNPEGERLKFWDDLYRKYNGNEIN